MEHTWSLTTGDGNGMFDHGVELNGNSSNNNCYAPLVLALGSLLQACEGAKFALESLDHDSQAAVSKLDARLSALEGASERKWREQEAEMASLAEDATATLRTAMEAIGHRDAELSKTRAEAAARALQVEQLMREAGAERARGEETAAALSQLQTRALAEQATVHSERGATVRYIHQLESQINSVQEEAQRWREEAERLQQQVRHLQAAAEAMVPESSQLQAQLSALQAQYSDLYQTHMNTQAMFNNEAATARSHAEASLRAQNEVRLLQSQVGEERAHRLATTEEMAALRAAVGEARAETKAALAQLAEERAGHKKAQARIQTLGSQLLALDQQHASTTGNAPAPVSRSSLDSAAVGARAMPPMPPPFQSTRLLHGDSKTYHPHAPFTASDNSKPSASASSSPIKPVTDPRDRDSMPSASANASVSTRQSLGSDAGVSIGKEALLDRLKLVQAERERLLKKASERLARRKAEQEQEDLMKI